MGDEFEEPDFSTSLKISTTEETVKFIADEEETPSQEEKIEDEDRITLSWSEVTVKTVGKRFKKNQPPPKSLLTDVKGIVKPGSLMAIIGASGAGKTTLLNILNFRDRTGLDVSGNV